MTETITKLAPEILSLIKDSKNILLHCHPSPDPDSVGSGLAMKFALESLGKKVILIQGDSSVPEAFSHFAGYAGITRKNFFEINLADFDLFIIQDAGSPGMISRKGEQGKETTLSQLLQKAPTLKTIVIDHHISNSGFAHNINLVDATYPSTTLILFDLFKMWGIRITPEIAGNLFIGAYTDTGGFKHPSMTVAAFAAVAELAAVEPHFSEMIFKMENNQNPQALAFQGLALSNIETFPLDQDKKSFVAIAAVTAADIKRFGITEEDDSTGRISNLLKSVVGWDVGVCCIELDSKQVKASFRTRDAGKFDVSVIAKSLGGGGHKAAAGAVITGTLAEVKKRIVEAIKAVL